MPAALLAALVCALVLLPIVFIAFSKDSDHRHA
jgi:hypothetical protein